MFLGRHEHSLDAKGRLTLPAEYRSAFSGGAVLSQLIDGCVAIWTPEEFERLATEMIEKARRGHTERNVARSFAAGAKHIELDSHGRIVIPQHLREFASLDRDVVITGAFNRVEVWDPRRWNGIDDEGNTHLRDAQDDQLSDMSF